MAENNNRRTEEELSIGEEKNGRGRTGAKRSAPYAAKKGKRAVNFFDILVIFVVATAIVLLVMGVSIGDIFGGDKGTSCKISYTLTFYNVEETFVTAIRKGDTLYDADNKADLGVVSNDVTSAPYTLTVAVTGVNAKGETVVTGEGKQVPGRYNVTVTITADAVYTKGIGYTVNGRVVRIGGTYHVRFPAYVGQGVCASIQQIP